MIQPLNNIPILSYEEFQSDIKRLIADDFRILAYFAVPDNEGFKLYGILANNQNEIWTAAWILDYYATQRPRSMGITAIQLFEREIQELHGIIFRDHPWPKPVRYPWNRFDRHSRIDNYPFYNIDSHELHLVNVGPVHAGIIEPGAFRFICNGEKIKHLEIALGYQHRGIESLICRTSNRLRQLCLAESIASDTTIGHTLAMVQIFDQKAPTSAHLLALEMERIAMHLADTAALCMDLAYQIGQVTAEALRTMVINTMQRWSGNRFGKGLIRPEGSHFDPNVDDILTTLREVRERFATLSQGICSAPTILARMEEICTVSRAQALEIGAVGMAARSVGLKRDSRIAQGLEPSLETEGDLMSRFRLRFREAEQSFDLIEKYSIELSSVKSSTPTYDHTLNDRSLYISTIEGWRGEICHLAITNDQGQFEHYKIYDPSFHNWIMLALSCRGAEISDFPVSNKSYNLSYCGHDL